MQLSHNFSLMALFVFTLTGVSLATPFAAVSLRIMPYYVIHLD